MKREKTALITGASKGLGRALARGLGARGWNLILTARDETRLRTVRDELAQITHVAAIAGDVNDPAHREALAVLARGHSGLDLVVNNAGALGPSPLPSMLEFPLEELAPLFASQRHRAARNHPIRRAGAQTWSAHHQCHERCSRQRLSRLGRIRRKQGSTRTGVSRTCRGKSGPHNQLGRPRRHAD